MDLGLLRGEKNTVFDNEGQREIFGTKRQKVKEDWRKLHT
jgi:hypothetical protein